MLDIRLSDTDLGTAVEGARGRTESALVKNSSETWAVADRFKPDRVGAIGEYAVAVACRVEWTPGIGVLDKETGDVEGWHVRATDLPHGGLIARPLWRKDGRGDADLIRLLLAIVGGNWVRLAGWLWGYEAKQDRWLHRHPTKPFYTAPQWRLSPLPMMADGRLPAAKKFGANGR